jgi:uncharacterized membrane protein YcfT
MEHIPQLQTPRSGEHVAWIDHAKGITIILVVMLYAHEWMTGAAGGKSWLRPVIDFAAPFRMPDFFLLSGLLLSRTIDRDWRTYLDRKVVHFAYFYALWLTILVAFEAPWTAAKLGWDGVGVLYLRSLYHPYGQLWFIYLLPVFFITTWLLRRAPVTLVWAAAAALQVAQLDSGVKVLEKFMPYYVFFYTGYVAAPVLLRCASHLSRRPALASALLALWALFEAAAVATGISGLPGVSLGLGFLGAAAVVTAGCVLAGTGAGAALAYCGRNSLAIYLGFYIPLVLAGKAVLDSGWVADPGIAALIATGAGVSAPLAFQRWTRKTRLRFLFERPERLRLATPARLQPILPSMGKRSSSQ